MSARRVFFANIAQTSLNLEIREKIRFTKVKTKGWPCKFDIQTSNTLFARYAQSIASMPLALDAIT